MIVKVWNDNDLDFKTKFKGEEVIVKARGFIEMELFEANDFRGQYHPVSVASNGLQDPLSFKMIRIERPSDSKIEVDLNAHVCMQCKKKYESEPVLKAHIDSAHADAQRLELPEMDEEIKKQGRPKKTA